jgi:ribosomal-protein-serine acetyltransferase
MLAQRLDERRTLRLIEPSDAHELYDVVRANRDHLAAWMPWAAGQTLEGTVAFIDASRKQLASNQGFQSAIVQDAEIVGVIGYHRVDWANRSTSVGYWLAESAQGRGTITAAASALADHAFDRWELNRLDIRAGVENHRSRAVAERLGFTFEGVLREAERIGDRYIDHAVYSMLARDWRERRAGSLTARRSTNRFPARSRSSGS